jgi:cytochrome c-type biogenesis protein
VIGTLAAVATSTSTNTGTGTVSLAGVAEAFDSTVSGGSLLLAVPVALIAGLISFASPCILPLVPGYVSYVTGLAGADLGSARRGRMVAGTLLFVLGFSVVFVSTGALLGQLGALLAEHHTLITKVLGGLTIVLGLAFLGLVPGMSRELRSHRAPTMGLLGAPLLGVLFGLGWTPCVGPTLGAVLNLAANEASAGRGALLTLVYCLGLGAPFVLTAVAFRRALGAFGWVKAHYVWVMRGGGAMLILLGVLLLTGAWTDISNQLRAWTSFVTVV